MTDDFKTAGVVSGIGATHYLVDVNVNCVELLNNASICVLNPCNLKIGQINHTTVF